MEDLKEEIRQAIEEYDITNSEAFNLLLELNNEYLVKFVDE